MSVKKEYAANQHVNAAARAIKAEERQKKDLELAARQRNFSKAIFEAGTKWALAGNDLTSAGEYADREDFIEGFARGLRLIKAGIDAQTYNASQGKGSKRS